MSLPRIFDSDFEAPQRGTGMIRNSKLQCSTSRPAFMSAAGSNQRESVRAALGEPNPEVGYALTS